MVKNDTHTHTNAYSMRSETKQRGPVDAIQAIASPNSNEGTLILKLSGSRVLMLCIHTYFYVCAHHKTAAWKGMLFYECLKRGSRAEAAVECRQLER